MSKKVLVIGGGAAGLLAAAEAAKNGADVTVAERNERPARKVMITGKGRCNVTNCCTMLNELVAAVPENGRFLSGAFSRFMPADTMELFESLGVELKVERGNRVFPFPIRPATLLTHLSKTPSEAAQKSFTNGFPLSSLRTEQFSAPFLKAEKSFSATALLLQPAAFPIPSPAQPETAMNLQSRRGII